MLESSLESFTLILHKYAVTGSTNGCKGHFSSKYVNRFIRIHISQILCKQTISSLVVAGNWELASTTFNDTFPQRQFKANAFTECGALCDILSRLIPCNAIDCVTQSILRSSHQRQLSNLTPFAIYLFRRRWASKMQILIFLNTHSIVAESPRFLWFRPQRVVDELCTTVPTTSVYCS